ncbi:hypothetical protein NMG60_11016993 [Bertholletia excelsa]
MSHCYILNFSSRKCQLKFSCFSLSSSSMCHMSTNLICGTDSQCKLQFVCLHHYQVPNPPKSQMSLDALLDCKNYIKLEMKNPDIYSPCTMDIGEKFMKLLVNGSFVLPKFTSTDKSACERVHDTPNNRIRKYKCTTSFNSRRVVPFFSVLSSMGTMVLIYMTLRGR